MEYSKETDSLGTIDVPESAYYGSQTQRARTNFIESSLRFPPIFMKALAMIKRFAASANQSLGLLPSDVAKSIVTAAEEAMAGKFDDQFVVDVFQTGSGTSTNMNMNEVLATRANELLTGKRERKDPVHPNDHVNLGQSSNDVIPSAIHIAALLSIKNELIPSLSALHGSLLGRADAFKNVAKTGRTHLQDAVPIALGDEFGGYARQVELGVRRIEATSEDLKELPLGGTAVGTGLNAHRDFAPKVISDISDYSGIHFREAENHFEAQAARDAVVEASGSLRTVAVSLGKIANDIRWLASGPRGGLGEIVIPSLQPGSSIMPGKVNPVIPESILQISAQVIGNDTTITICGQGGNFELNTMLPLMAYDFLQSIELLASGALSFAERCIHGIAAQEEICSGYVERSLALATYLTPRLGYDRAAQIAKKAHDTGKSIKQVVLEQGILSPEELNECLPF